MTVDWIPANERAIALEDDLFGVFSIHSVTDRGNGIFVFKGEFLRSPEMVYEQVSRGFKQRGYLTLLRREGGEDVLIAYPAPDTSIRQRYGLHLLLFVLTVVSTWMSGAFQWVFEHAAELGIAEDQALGMGEVFRLMLQNWQGGMPFMLALLGILGVHEFGHYFVARYYKLDVSLPYFIPFPFNYLTGTLGAVIRIQSPFESRKALFDVGIAGPLAGLALAFPIVALGLSQASIVQIDPAAGATVFGEPLLFQWMADLIVGPRGPGEDIVMNPLLMAGWWGFFITALNLVPVSQLDGGHIAYALFGRYHRTIARIVFMVAAAVTLLVSPGYLIMLLLVFFMGIEHPPALDDLSSIGTPRRILGILTLILFLLLFTPVPLTTLG